MADSVHKGIRGKPSKSRGPARVSKMAGAIWGEAPIDYDTQGRFVRFHPTFDYVVNPIPDLAGGQILIGPYRGWLDVKGTDGPVFSAAGGVLTMTTEASTNSSMAVNLNGGGGPGPGNILNAIRYVSAQEVRFGIRFKISSAASISFAFGLQNENSTDLFTPQYGAWFEVVNSAKPVFYSKNASGTTTIVPLDEKGGVVPVPAADTYVDVGFVLQSGAIEVWWNGTRVTDSAPSYINTSDMTMFWGVKTKTTAAKTLTVQQVGVTRSVG